MKISIRFSIITLIVTLLLGLSFAIVIPVMYYISGILYSNEENFLHLAGDKVTEQIIGFLQPLERSTYIGAQLIHDNAMYLASNKGLLSLLYHLNYADKNITSVYWADEKGNFFLVKELSPTSYLNENIIKTQSGIKLIDNIYDDKLNLVSSKKNKQSNNVFDPTTRPWYQSVKINQKQMWSIYPSLQVGTAESEFGITSSVPVYDNYHKLRGVFAIDITLQELYKFLASIKVTPNSFIFICNNKQQILAINGLNDHLRKNQGILTIKKLNVPLLERSFEKFQKNRKEYFYYSTNYQNEHQTIFNLFKEIPYLIGNQKWYVVIITPGTDVVQPIEHAANIVNIIILSSIIIALLLAALFSSLLSKPIKQLAKNAELICNLQLKDVAKIFSHIKEIDLMVQTFEKMKNTLQSFERYIPITLVKNLLLTGKIAVAGGETRQLSIFFSDIENFTTLSESMSPELVMKYLSEYFQTATKVILETGGTVDKYIGDGIMAFWGAPIEDKDHALHACQAALKMQKTFQELNDKWRSENKPTITTRMGISSGNVIVGNVGSDDRLSYTSLGDTVNISSRLEQLNKTYKTHLIIDKVTYDFVKDATFNEDFLSEKKNLEHKSNAKIQQSFENKKYTFNFRFLDKVVLKGKKHGGAIYELLGIKELNDPDAKLEYKQKFQLAFEKYTQGDWIVALNLFTALSEQHPDDYLPQVFMERCILLLKKPPKKWNGLWIMHNK